MKKIFTFGCTDTFEGTYKHYFNACDKESFKEQVDKLNLEDSDEQVTLEVYDSTEGIDAFLHGEIDANTLVQEYSLAWICLDFYNPCWAVNYRTTDESTRGQLEEMFSDYQHNQMFDKK